MKKIENNLEINGMVNEPYADEQPAPKKRGRKPKAETANTVVPAIGPDDNRKPLNNLTNCGAWSTPAKNIPMTYMTVEIQWLENALGLSPNSKKLLEDFIASNAPDAPSREQEIEALGEENIFDRSVNIFPREISFMITKLIASWT